MADAQELGKTSQRYNGKFQVASDGVIELGPAKIGPLTLRWRLARKTPSLVERTLEVTAEAAQRFAITFPLDLTLGGEFATFTGAEKARTFFDTVRGSAKTETFPVAMMRASGRVFGIVADSPGLWENRCQVLLDPPALRLAVLTGDGRDPYPLVAVYAQRFIAQRYACIGDAAVGMHPATAHGFNFGLRGACSLARGIRDALAKGTDIAAPAVLEPWEREHKRGLDEAPQRGWVIASMKSDWRRVFPFKK